MKYRGKFHPVVVSKTLSNFPSRQEFPYVRKPYLVLIRYTFRMVNLILTSAIQIHRQYQIKWYLDGDNQIYI